MVSEWHCLCLCEGLIKDSRFWAKFLLSFGFFSYEIEALRPQGNCERTEKQNFKNEFLPFQTQTNLVCAYPTHAGSESIRFYVISFMKQIFYGVESFFCGILLVNKYVSNIQAFSL